MASKTASIPVILVSAGSAGLGAAAARLFCKNGYRVVVNYSSNAERANQLVAETLPGLSPLAPAEHQGAFAAVQADLSRRDDIVRLVDESVRRMGRLDVVFSNGGWTRIRDMTSIDGKLFLSLGFVLRNEINNQWTNDGLVALEQTTYSRMTGTSAST